VLTLQDLREVQIMETKPEISNIKIQNSFETVVPLPL
jgi:hypothetical protein